MSKQEELDLRIAERNNLRLRIGAIQENIEVIDGEIGTLRAQTIKEGGHLGKFAWMVYGSKDDVELRAIDIRTHHAPELCKLFNLNPRSAHMGHYDWELDNATTLYFDDGEIVLRFESIQTCVNFIAEHKLTVDVIDLRSRILRLQEEISELDDMMKLLGTVQDHARMVQQCCDACDDDAPGDVGMPIIMQLGNGPGVIGGNDDYC